MAPQTVSRLTVGALVVLALGLGALGWLYYDHTASLSETLSAREAELTSAQEEIGRLTEALNSTRESRDSLAIDLVREKNRNDNFEEQIGELSGTIGKLDKLSQTDPELLKKYSKVYFLNENYAPAKLVLLDDEDVYDESREYYLLKEVVPFLEDMLAEAKDDGVDLWVASAFRSFETQNQLKNGYSVTYGSGANAFSADQGYSEHQLGTTVDLTTTGLEGGLEGFGETEAYEWLTKNAYKYGFALSYPEDNSYYIFEPWHWRFVGRDLARDLHKDDQHFYDLDQRKLDEYLISIFD